jgi:Uncharacterised ArCR, COG2043
MADYNNLEKQITEALGLSHRPVAVTFARSAPSGVRKFSGTEPAGCSFWRLAERGSVFYTEPGDHYNCAVGCFTHSIALPAERASEMDQTLAFMMQLGYIKAEDLTQIAQLRETPRLVVYAPLGETPVAPDVVLFAGKPSAIMLLNEASLRAGIGAQTATLGRPTCMALPAALERGVRSARVAWETASTPTSAMTSYMSPCGASIWNEWQRKLEPSPMPMRDSPTTIGAAGSSFAQSELVM